MTISAQELAKAPDHVHAICPDRVGDPYAPPHPRAVDMANTILDLNAISPGVTYRDLIGAGYTSAEIIEHHPEAEKIAADRAVYRRAEDPDRLADMIAKARSPLPNKLPLPRCTKETQALFIAWGRYCAARSAYLIDPWPGQREHCLERLTTYLHKIPLFPRERKDILIATARALQEVSQ